MMMRITESRSQQPTMMMMTTIKDRIEQLRKSEDRQKLEAALRVYCKFYLRPGDLDEVPELRKYLPQK